MYKLRYAANKIHIIYGNNKFAANRDDFLNSTYVKKTRIFITITLSKEPHISLRPKNKPDHIKLMASCDPNRIRPRVV